MTESQTKFAVLALSVIPYAAVAWGYEWFVGGGRRDFWMAMGVLIAVSAFISVIEGIGGIIVWRVIGKKRMVDDFVRVFRANEFPAPEVETDDLSNYLARLIGDTKLKPDCIRVAYEFEALGLAAENRGILAGMRFHAAAEQAFKQYTPTAPRNTPPKT